MVTTVVIDTMDKVMELLSEQERIEAIDRYRNAFLYRGMPNAAWKLCSSLKLNCKEKQKELEPIILRNFTKYAVIDDPEIGNSVWRQMIVGRHHGLPTRLLDWSHSPLIGLHFATTGESLNVLDKHDAVVWKIDMEELHSLLPERYQAPLKSNRTLAMSVDLLDGACPSLSQYDEDMGSDSMVIVEPPSIEPRIINQYSYFSLVPCNMDDIEGFLDKHTKNTVKYVVKKEIKWRIRDMLDQLNVNERVVYPGLDGLSKWLARRYYVKK